MQLFVCFSCYVLSVILYTQFKITRSDTYKMTVYDWESSQELSLLLNIHDTAYISTCICLLHIWMHECHSSYLPTGLCTMLLAGNGWQYYEYSVLLRSWSGCSCTAAHFADIGGSGRVLLHAEVRLHIKCVCAVRMWVG